MILSGKLMLEHLGERDAAQRLESRRRGRDRRRRARDLRPEADARRPDRGRHLRVRGRDHREAALTPLGTKENVNGGRRSPSSAPGNVGATCAQELARRDYADVVLVDIIPNFPQGKALDIEPGGLRPRLRADDRRLERLRRRRRAPTSSSITAGMPRSPGMSRDDLVTTNEAIVAVGHEGGRQALAETRSSSSSRTRSTRCATSRRPSRGSRRSASSAWRASSTPPASRPSSRRRPALGEGREAMVLGGHGDQMVPVVSATTVGGVPLDAARSRRADREDGRADAKGGGELVDLLGTSAWYAPGAAAAQMVDAICLDQKRVLPCTALPRGRVRHRRALHGRPGQARRGGRRGDREAAS